MKNSLEYLKKTWVHERVKKLEDKTIEIIKCEKQKDEVLK